MSNQWDKPGIPHKGWELIDVEDIREAGQSEYDTHYEQCMICGNEKIRYVHILEHPEIEQQYRVGCICAEKLTNDYVNPRKRENYLKNKAERKKTWIKRDWRVSIKGNRYMNIDKHNVGIIRLDNKKYKCRIDSKFGSICYDTLKEAKIGLFNKIEDLKEKGEW